MNELMIGATAVGGMASIPVLAHYLVSATDASDAFYWIRKTQFKRKLHRMGYENLWDFLDTLLTTNVSDWKKEEVEMSYSPFPNTTILLRNVFSNRFDLIIREGRGYEWVLWLEFHEHQKGGYLHDAFDILTKKKVNETEAFQVKQILFYLKEMYDHFETMEQEQQAQATHARHFEQKKEELLVLLTKPFCPNEPLTQRGFCVTRTQKDVYQILTISYEDTVYFHAMVMRSTAKLSTNFSHASGKYGSIFAACQNELETFAQQVLMQGENDRPVFENSVVNPFASSVLSEHHQERLQEVVNLMAELREQHEWLSVDALHHVSETFPKDLQALNDIYRVVKEKEKVQEDVASSLDTMYEKLLEFAQQAEHNKKLALQKTKLIIEKR